MSEEKDEWYLSQKGETTGPMSFVELQQQAQAGKIEPRVDLVMGGGLETWTSAAEVEGLFKRGGDEEEGGEEASDKKRMSEPLAASADFDEEDEVKVYDLPGANRLGYFAGVFILPTVLMVALIMGLATVAETAGEQIAAFLPLLFLAPIIVAFVVTVKRFQNLAMSGWWILGLMVPILQWWLSYRLFACPPGYAYTKRLDGLGWFLAVIFWLVIVGSFAMTIYSGMQQWQEFRESGSWEEFIRQFNASVEEMREQSGKPAEEAP